MYTYIPSLLDFLPIEATTEHGIEFVANTETRLSNGHTLTVCYTVSSH